MSKIALCQVLPKAGEPNINFSVMNKIIKNYSKKGVKLCVFPEDYLYGILRDRFKLVDAGKKFHYWTHKFTLLAKYYHIDLIPGTFPRYYQQNIYNTTVYINHQGKILNKYAKNNLWLSERAEYRPGTETPQCFESVLGKTAIIICWDIFDHRLFESAVKQDAQWVIVLSFWSINQSEDNAQERGRVTNTYPDLNDSNIIDSLIQSRVAEYNLGIIFCNFAKFFIYPGNTGKKQIAISANRTQIVCPFNKVQKRITNRKETILLYDVPSIIQYIKDFEICYGRREDIVQSYPYLTPE